MSDHLSIAGEWETTECPPSRCLGATNITRQCQGEHRDQAADNQLCGRCEPDYADIGGNCVRECLCCSLRCAVLVDMHADCPKANPGLIVLLFAVMWALVFLLHLSSQATTGESRLPFSMVLMLQSDLLVVD
jgi:hypothetical protein